jgi:hypothetical protein
VHLEVGLLMLGGGALLGALALGPWLEFRAMRRQAERAREEGRLLDELERVDSQIDRLSGRGAGWPWFGEAHRLVRWRAAIRAASGPRAQAK